MIDDPRLQGVIRLAYYAGIKCDRCDFAQCMFHLMNVMDHSCRMLAACAIVRIVSF